MKHQNCDFSTGVDDVAFDGDHRISAAFVRIALFVVVGLFGSGCFGPTNDSACRDYVEAHNAAHEECGLDTRINEEEACPPGIDDGVDCTDYYSTLAESYKCESDGTVTYNPKGECG